ncbi:MAG: SCP2 sterol-binding domain-containing protein [Burkholderiales bacterium]|nr:SCP2 sterol-binding domain-containing protein [Burkholderiales bacterium]
MISSTFSQFLNHLLAQESWARAVLQKHAGKLACIDLEVLQIRVRVAADGYVQSVSDTELQEDVRLNIKLADLPLIAQDSTRAVSYVKIEGDADFAQAISQLSQDLRWEVEDDLSRVVGDIAARRVVSGGRQIAHFVGQTHQKVQENFADYFLEENPMLVRPRAVRAFADQVNKTRDDVERLMKRLERLERSGRLEKSKVTNQ